MASATQQINDVYGLTWQEKLDTLSACKCCTRHQINKPLIFKTYVDTNPDSPDSPSPLSICPCKCRHLARFICRQTYEYNGVGGYLSRPNTPTSVIR